MNIKQIIKEEIGDFDWAEEIEADIRTSEYFMITSKSVGGGLSHDEWVLFKILNRDVDDIYYDVVYHNLRPGTNWSSNTRSRLSTMDFDRLVGLPYRPSGYDNDLIEKPHWLPIDKSEIPEKTYPDTFNDN